MGRIISNKKCSNCGNEIGYIFNYFDNPKKIQTNQRKEFVRINVEKEFLKRGQSLSGITFKIIEYRFCETRENPRSGTWKTP